jgi:6-phosphogluconolactonase (cycloisomerase 2 family)
VGNDVFAYVGNWKIDGDGYGISICRYDVQAGTLEYLKTVLPEISVGATFLDAPRNILYCTDERSNHPAYGPGGGGRVYALAIDPESGDLTEINQQPSYAALPSYVTADRDRNYLLVTNHAREVAVAGSAQDVSGKYRLFTHFDDATTVLYRLNSDGSIGDPCDIRKHSPGGPGGKYRNPHPHSVNMSPSGELFAVCDKGADQIVVYRIDRDAGKLVVCGGGGHAAIPGSAPRYGAFHPTLPYFFMNNESLPVVCSFRYDEQGNLDPIATVDALPDDPDLEAEQSDLRITSSGKYLYDLIRGANVVSVFEIDETSGKLARIQTLHLDGNGPRGCALSPDERFLLVANVASTDVIVLSVGNDGRLSPTTTSLALPRPGNVTFFDSRPGE